MDFDPATVCRICLSSTNKLLNIFSSTVVDGYITAVPHMISQCLDLQVSCGWLYSSLVKFWWRVLCRDFNLHKIYLQVSVADGLPDKVCGACKSNIVNFFTFKEKSKRSETVLRSTLRPKTPSTPAAACDEAQTEDAVPVAAKSLAAPYPSPIKREPTVAFAAHAPIKREKAAAATPPPDFSVVESLAKDYNQEEADATDAADVEMIFNCEMCDESFDTLNRLKDHCEASHDEVTSIEQKNIKEEVLIVDDDDDDGDESVGSAEEESAVDYYHGEEAEDESVIADPAGSDEEYIEYTDVDQLADFSDELHADFLCHCGKSFPNDKQLKIHIKTHDETPDDEMEVDAELELYIVDRKADQNECRCVECEISFEDRDQLVLHYQELHDYFCAECALVFSKEDALLLHNINVHQPQQTKPKRVPAKLPATSVAEFRCTHCDKSIRGQLKFDQHQKMHDAMNVINNYVTFYPCHQCHLIFLTEGEGNDHRSFHDSTDKPANDQYVDASCTDYQFLDEDGYEDNSYGCGQCEAVFPNSADAKFHLVSHSAVFTCPYDVCGCQYDNFGRYTSHIMNKHVNGQDHRCTHCGSQFDSFDDLQAHMKHNCAERKYACNHCGKFNLIFKLILYFRNYIRKFEKS